MNKLIGYYYTKQNDLCVMFSLPYMLPEYFLITSDMMNMQFNQPNHSLDVLTSELLNRLNRFVLYPLPYSTVHSPLLKLLGGSVFRGQQAVSHRSEEVFS